VDRHIGEKLNEARERLGETPQYVARALKVRVVDYLQIEAGTRRLGGALIIQAAALLRVDVAWFFEGLAGDERPKAEADYGVLPTNVVDLDIARLGRSRR